MRTNGPYVELEDSSLSRFVVTTKAGSPIKYPKYLEYNVEIHVDDNIYIYIYIYIYI
jgi:hypothetical protein